MNGRTARAPKLTSPTIAEATIASIREPGPVMQLTEETFAALPLMTVVPVPPGDELQLIVLLLRRGSLANVWAALVIRKVKMLRVAEIMTNICILWRLIQPPHALLAFSALVSFSS